MPEKKPKFFKILLGKIEFFCEIVGKKIEISREFASKNQNFVDPDP